MKKKELFRFISFGIFLATLIPGGIFLHLGIAIPSIACLTIAIISAFSALLPFPFLEEDGDKNENTKS